MKTKKIYLVWCQPYDDCAQDIKVFADDFLAEEYYKEQKEYCCKERIPAVMEMTEAMVIFPNNIIPFDGDEFSVS